jgi:hypothetical protein
MRACYSGRIPTFIDAVLEFWRACCFRRTAKDALQDFKTGDADAYLAVSEAMIDKQTSAQSSTWLYRRSSAVAGGLDLASGMAANQPTNCACLAGAASAAKAATARILMVFRPRRRTCASLRRRLHAERLGDRRELRADLCDASGKSSRLRRSGRAIIRCGASRSSVGVGRPVTLVAALSADGCRLRFRIDRFSHRPSARGAAT